MRNSENLRRLSTNLSSIGSGFIRNLSISLILFFVGNTTLLAGTLLAGAGSAVIVTNNNDPIGSWGKKKEGHISGFDTAQAVALTISDGDNSITLVSVDTLLIYKGTVERVLNKLPANIRHRKLLLTATHGHANLEPVGNRADEYNNRIAEAIVRAVISASAKDQLKQVKIGYGRGEYMGASLNRVVRDGNGRSVTKWKICREDVINGWRPAHQFDPIDDEVSVVHVTTLDGKTTIATLFNYAAHPVIFGEANTYATPDFPGQARRMIERSIGGKALFLQGAAGDINPKCGLLNSANAHLEMVEFGNGLASTVTSIVRNISNHSSLPKLSSKDSSVKFKPACPIAVDPIVSLTGIKIGENINIATISGEPFVKIGMDIKKKINNKNNIILVLGYTNGANAYIPDQKSFGTGAYGTTHNQWGCVQRETGSSVVAEIIKIFTSM